MLRGSALIVSLATLLGAAACLPEALAQEPAYPARQIKVIIPNPPGGPGDVIARAFADRAAQSIGTQFIFEYRAGASTTIGTQAVARAEPDGYTILGFPSAGLTVSVLRKTMPYNLESDLRPIVGMGSVPLALVVRADLQLKTFDEFGAAVRKGDLKYGSGGVGTLGHLSSAALMTELKGRATHVPMRGNPEVVQNVMGGHLDFGFVSVADAAAVAGTNNIQVLGVTADRRAAGLEKVPTLSELGFPEFNPKLWYAFLAPSQTPTDRVMRLYKAFADAASDPAVVKQLGALGFVVELRDPEALSKMMKGEATRWKKVIDDNKITVAE